MQVRQEVTWLKTVIQPCGTWFETNTQEEEEISSLYNSKSITQNSNQVIIFH